MSRRRTLLVTAVAALAITAPVAAQGNKTTIKLVEKQTFFHEYDRAPKGPSASDLIVIRGTLSDGNGHPLGHDAVRCSGDRRCHATLSLPGGTLVGSGRQTSNAFTVPIVSGTRQYAKAHGTIHVTLGQQGSRYLIEIG